MTATPTHARTRLEDVLAYRHPGVVRRYCKDHGATPEEAAEIFRETLKWLYLCYRATTLGPEGVPCVMHPELARIDWMWHTFLLFTLDYADFCERYFGIFLHHVPNEAEDEDEGPVDDVAYRAALEQQYALVYDVLGEETLRAWHEHCQYAAN
jgi:hypothetical protein